MEYRFLDENGEHLHQIQTDGEWKNLTGTTTVLGVIAKPALIPWAANMTVGYIREHIGEYDLTDLAQFEQMLQDAKSAHRKKKEKAGDWGTELHAEVERYIKNSMICIAGWKDTTKYDDKIKQFIEWAKQNNTRFLASEKNVWSERMWTGGIVDFICEIDGKRWIGDIKTSNSGVHPENFWQCAAYDMMLQEQGEPRAEGYLILNIKENGEFAEKRNISIEENQQAFLSCLNIYRTLEKIKLNI